MIELPAPSVLLVGTGLYLMAVATTLRALRGGRSEGTGESEPPVPENDVSAERPAGPESA
ncbi:hypothetical protein [Natronococcus occultus]|uniref:Uncharacterized protein n=1 Tax=Natronococcus occultus SP4 TaxID=694430 RepID=L0JYA7_9EURY|nr:hypothetical protein [Natronococcus occultus]AGB38037.1 hypothetical protein Natoc_2259 [Natronococcus occultus SP4]